MAVFLKDRVRSFTIKGTVKFIPPDSMDHVRENAVALSNPDVMARILRQAAAETLIKAYRERFLAKLPGAVNMQLDKHAKVADPRIDAQLQKTFRERYRELGDAYLSGDSEGMQRIRSDLNTLRGQIVGQLKLRDRSRRGKLPSGQFRELAMKVLNLVADPSEMVIAMSGDALVGGIGNIAMLNAIKTPSATDELTGHPTTSKRNILWRQLEFGSGAFSTRPQDQRGKFRLPSGGWWYGHAPDNSLHLRGSKPIAALRDPERQLPYEADSIRFRSVFAQLLGAALFGA